MTVGSFAIPGVPGVYRQARQRVAELPRVRTDVAGFVGVAGAEPRRRGGADRRLAELTSSPTCATPPVTRSLRRPARCSPTAVRAFFANGGARCWIVNVATSVDTLDRRGAARHDARRQRRRVGLELLLLPPEVAIVGMPELDAVVADDEHDHEAPAAARRLRLLPVLPDPAAPGSVISTQRTLGRPLLRRPPQSSSRSAT